MISITRMLKRKPSILKLVLSLSLGSLLISCQTNEEIDKLLQTKNDNCPKENFVFSKQETINNFKTSYPNCTVLSSNITISGDDITDLSGLEQITAIDSVLLITNNPNLESLKGLENLSYTGGFFSITYNDKLSSLEGLDNFTHAKRGMAIANNNVLTKIGNLPSLKTVDTVFNISSNPKLTAIDNSLGLKIVSGMLYISENDRLTDLSGLTLEQVNGDIIIDDNYAIKELNWKLTTSSIKGYFHISFNPLLTSVKAGLNDLTSIEGDLIITSSPLESMNGFESLTQIGGDLQIDNVSSLSGLFQLSQVGGDVQIQSCMDLPNLNGFQGLLEVGGDLDIESTGITSVYGIHRLKEIKGSFIFGINDNVSELSLGNFAALETIGGDLLIAENNGLTSISGFSNLKSVGGTSLSIQSNPKLNDCGGFCDFIKNSGYSGDYTFEDNMINCNSTTAIEENCN